MIYRNGKYNNYGKKKRGAAEAKELPLKNVLQSWFDEHEIPSDFNAAEIVFYRSFINLLFMLVLIKARGIPVKTPLWRLHIQRSGIKAAL